MGENNYRKHISSIEEYEEAKSYWFDKLSGDISGIKLQSDSTETLKQKKEIYKISFNNELSAKLLQVSKNQDGSLYVLLLAAFKTFLYKCTDQSDIVVCSPVYNYEEETDSFNKYILLRDSLSDEMTFKEVLSSAAKTVSGGFKYQYYPMDRLFKLLGFDQGATPALNVGLALENIHHKELINWIADSRENDFIISISRNGDKLEGSIIYKADRFKEDTVEKISERFFHILTQALDNSGKKLADIELITNEEKQKILYDFNNTEIDYPKDKTISQLFEQQAGYTPDKIAIVCENEQLTYRQLNEKSNQLAKILREKGVKADSIVGIMVERSLELIVGILGILKAGGAYLPIDLDYPKERIKYMLDDSATKILLTQEHLKDRIDNVGFEGEIIDLTKQEVYEGECSNPVSINKPEDMAYIIYTSGTTGKPKGVMVSHTGVANLKVFFEKTMGIHSDNRMLQFASCSFDASVWEMFMALLLGATLYIPTKDVIEDIGKFEDYINSNEITIATLPPSYASNISSERIKSLKKLFTAGSETNLILYGKWKDKVEYINAYGPTETTVCATVWRDMDTQKELKSIPIGKPITNTKIYIINKNKQLQPMGIQGELCISGTLVAKGYLNKPELTAEKFIPNPFIPGEKMYRTGDLVRWLPDGNIEFFGRMDHQVKVRGYRIELGEIENVLLKHNSVKSVKVIAREEQGGEKYLCAYLTADEEISVTVLREHLSMELPDYMIPSYFVQLEKLPLTHNGKVDTKALPEPNGNVNTGAEYEAPGNHIEEALVRLWEDVLKVNNIGINEDFFKLGGDSIKAIVLANKMNMEFMTDHSSRILFELRTIKEISKIIQQNYFDTIKNRDCAVFNKDKSKALIFFPPIVGYGLIYDEIARHLTDYKLYCYDFIETETVIEDYVDKITKIQEENEYVFVGYSSGGGLAFEVADRMWKQGYKVTDIVLIDTLVPGTEDLENIDEEEKKITENVTKWVMENMPEQLEHFNENMISKTKAYFKYCKNPVNVEKVSSNIHFIVSSEDEDADVAGKNNRNENARAWSKMTSNEFYIYEGHGKHSMMINEGYADKNAKIITEIMDKVQGRKK